RDCDAILAHETRQTIDFVMGNAEKLLKQAQLIHQLESGWMDGVATEVAQKVSMLLQHRHAHPGARQQKTKHHSRRPTTGNATSYFDRVWAHLASPRRITTNGRDGLCRAAYACLSGVDTIRPSRSSVTLIWHDSREFGRTS